MVLRGRVERLVQLGHGQRARGHGPERALRVRVGRARRARRQALRARPLAGRGLALGAAPLAHEVRGPRVHGAEARRSDLDRRQAPPRRVLAGRGRRHHRGKSGNGCGLYY